MGTSPPSIPSHDHVFGYETNERGDLVKQPNPLKPKGKDIDEKGPGYYGI
jgi:hypothetical protein